MPTLGQFVRRMATGSLFKDLHGRLSCVPFYMVIDLEQTFPADEDIFDSPSQCCPLRLIDFQITKVEKEPLARTVFSPDTFDEVKI